MNRFIRIFFIADAIILSFLVPFTVVYMRQEAILEGRGSILASVGGVINQTKSAEQSLLEQPEYIDPNLIEILEQIGEVNESLKKKTQASKIPDVPSISVAHKVLKKVAICESGNNALATNDTSTAKGLLQIINGTWRHFRCTGNVFDPEDNFQCGIKIATKSGLHHWDESRSCWSKLVTVGDLQE